LPESISTLLSQTCRQAISSVGMAHLRVLTTKCAGDAKVPGNYRKGHIQKYKWGPRGETAARQRRDRSGDLAVPGDDEIGSGVSRRLARAARHPTDPPPIAHHIRRGERLISEVRMSSLDHARDAVDFVATAVNAVGLVEYGVCRGVRESKHPTASQISGLALSFGRTSTPVMKFCEMQIHSLKMKRAAACAAPPTVRDHGGTGHLGPRTEFVRNSRG
jgi:hypothetical protein